MVVFSNEVCSTFTVMSLRTLLSDHVICTTEHHLKDFEMDMMSIEYYKLGNKVCRQYKNGSVCVYVHESIDSDIISTHHIRKEKDLEICAVKINLPKIKIVIIPIYRSPTGNYNYFLRKSDSFLNLLYTKKMEFIICGDININYLHCHNRRQQTLY